MRGLVLPFCRLVFAGVSSMPGLFFRRRYGIFQLQGPHTFFRTSINDIEIL